MISIGNLQINKLYLGDVEVTKAYLGDVEVYGSTPQPVGKYMTMTVLDGASGTTIAPTVTGKLPNLNLQYRINSNGDWTNFIVGTTADIHLTAGDWVQFKGVNESGIADSTANYLNFAISGNPVALSGNVMSLIDGVGETLVIPTALCFCYLFSNSNVKTVSSDFLPATELTSYCYYNMFYGCQNLTQAPVLPATTIADNCYAYMFKGCKSLVTAPELPATTLAYACYANMFTRCTALVNAPELPATTLAEYCYANMFEECTSLTTAPELPATTLAEDCYEYMFAGCTSLTTAPELPATTLVGFCYQMMFWECQSLNYVKSLATDITAMDALTDWLFCVSSTGTFVKPAGVTYPTGDSGIPVNWTVVEEKPYMTMKVDKSAGETTIAPTVTGTLSPNLQYRVNDGNWTDFVFGTTADIHVVAGDVVQWKGNNPNGLSKNSNYLNFAISDNVHLSGNIMSLIYGDDFVDKTVIPNTYCFFSLFKGSSIKTVSSDFLPATTLKSDCYRYMFSGCKTLTTAPELPATTLADSCYWSMFENCSSLVTAPSLPATTLVDFCYIFMFYNCKKLTTAPELHATKLASSCYQNMFLGCSNLNYVKSHATDISASNALSNWLLNVASSGTFVKPAGVSYKTGGDGIPSGWTIQNI